MSQSKVSISNWSAICLIILFTVGSALVTMPGKNAGPDVLISLAISFIISIALTFLYSRILLLYPGKSMMEVQEIAFGRIISRIFYIITIIYSLHIATTILMIYGEFLQIVSLSRTPRYFLCSLFAVLGIWLVKDGIEVLSRWARFYFPLFLAVVLSLTLFIVTDIKLHSIGPFLFNGWRPVFNAAFTLIAFPFATSMFFTEVLNKIEDKKKIFKVYVTGISISTLVLLMVFVRNLTILGPSFIKTLYFPTHAAIGIINIADYLQRIEAAVSINLIITGLARFSVCLYVASKAFANIFSIKSYKQIVAPMGFITMVLTLFAFSDMMEMFEWLENTYPYYVLPFFILLPIITLIGGKIKKSIDKNKKYPQSSGYQPKK